MFTQKRTIGILVLLMGLAAISYGDQPFMQAARANLQQARTQLQSASRNKGGHRAQAIIYINAAISEVDQGIRFDRRHNHALFTLLTNSPDQPHMQRALDLLNGAKSNLEGATADKGGHRVKALGYVNSAIDEVKKGIDAGE